ncbi:AraC family transcriptional regulator [Embleya sp. NBC_00888]|uniref:AraC family transcriptional regulator n=1 Tax=Embleya sp. NBC_00888 TaxID=2975960 RepID=UPI002F90966F
MDVLAADAPVWHHAAADPVVGEALHLLHDDPAHPWTVAEPAARTGLSRAAFARRFSARVGEPPMTHVASRRIALAADPLGETDATVASIARQVGCADTFALGVAFKRIRGITPTRHRDHPPARHPTRLPPTDPRRPASNRSSRSGGTP